MDGATRLSCLVVKSFLVFPTGVPGAGLLLLRISIASALSAATPALIPAFLDIGVAVVIIGLTIGLFTRAAAVLSTAAAVFLCINLGGPLGMAAALLGLCALALAMLGGGSYSVDALLFGRRVIRLTD